MPQQNPLGAYVATSAGSLVPLTVSSGGLVTRLTGSGGTVSVSGQNFDATGNLLVANGGTATAYNVTSAVVIKNTAGRLERLVVNAPGGTSGSWTLNDAATVSGATSANQIISIPYSGTNNIAGAVFNLDWPCSAGIVVSTVPGGSPVAAISYK